MNEQYFIYQLKPVRENLMVHQTVEEQSILESHFFYLKSLKNEHKLLLAGPCLDAAFGIVILQGLCEEEAHNVMQNDPAVYEKIMTAELHPFRVSLLHESVKK
ncbi:YciI family protein [Fictibacillus iocasae]|uniref:YciI family protein n=1 Tax=Fictibacillus iocasae TaxID=2715437 RepID=A0ABW2NIS8_9BACL